MNKVIEGNFIVTFYHYTIVVKLCDSYFILRLNYSML